MTIAIDRVTIMEQMITFMDENTLYETISMSSLT